MHVLMRLATQGKLNAAFKSYLASLHKLEKITCGYKIYIFNRNRLSFSRQVFSNISFLKNVNNTCIQRKF